MALVIILTWLGIQLVGVLPKAITSLASIADTVYNYEEVHIDVTSSKAVANTGESFGLSWQVPKTPGDFTFTYTCTDGVAVDVRTIGSAIKPVTCGEAFNLGSVSGVDVMVQTEKNRFTNIPYTIAFVPTGADTAIASADSTMSVVNASIPPTVAVATTTPEVVVPTTPVTSVEPTVPTPTKPAVTPTAKPVVTPKPTYVQHYTYAIPVSNPNGFADLAVKLVRVGTISGGAFTTNSVVDNDTSSGLLFEIKNIGTKTSTAFTYTVALPNGTTYTSPVQDALKPNERATIAIGFEVANLTGVKSFSVQVANAGETITANNGMSGLVSITD